MSDSSKSLTRKQDLALEALIGSPTLGLAAAKAGVTERTIYRWITTDDSFKSEYLKLRREVLSNAVFQLQKASNNAVNTLVSVMNDPESPASARVAAAVKVLELSFKSIESDDLEIRISALEQDRA